jgi:hypothetical protein
MGIAREESFKKDLALLYRPMGMGVLREVRGTVWLH